jgi:hypothetical protein
VTGKKSRSFAVQLLPQTTVFVFTALCVQTNSRNVWFPKQKLHKTTMVKSLIFASLLASAAAFSPNSLNGMLLQNDFWREDGKCPRIISKPTICSVEHTVMDALPIFGVKSRTLYLGQSRKALAGISLQHISHPNASHFILLFFLPTFQQIIIINFSGSSVLLLLFCWQVVPPPSYLRMLLQQQHQRNQHT